MYTFAYTGERGRIECFSGRNGKKFMVIDAVQELRASPALR